VRDMALCSRCKAFADYYGDPTMRMTSPPLTGRSPDVHWCRCTVEGPAYMIELRFRGEPLPRECLFAAEQVVSTC